MQMSKEDDRETMQIATRENSRKQPEMTPCKRSVETRGRGVFKFIGLRHKYANACQEKCFDTCNEIINDAASSSQSTCEPLKQ